MTVNDIKFSCGWPEMWPPILYHKKQSKTIQTYKTTTFLSSSHTLCSDITRLPGVFETAGGNFSLWRRTATGTAFSFQSNLLLTFSRTHHVPPFFFLSYMMLEVAKWRNNLQIKKPCSPPSSPLETLLWTWSFTGRICWISWSLR